ncbi:MAG: InlB B-repeat-containing protein, partial [Bacteroidota bacterium]
GWTIHNVNGEQTWTIPGTQYGHNNSYCAYMNGYHSGAQENENWLVSPAFSPDDYDNLRLSFWNTSGYNGPGLQLYWSANYSGDPQTAVWTEINNVQWHDGITDWVWTFSESIDLSTLTGPSAHIAFKYTSTSQQAAAWELDNILLSHQLPDHVYHISVAANPASGGSVTGAGTYLQGETVEMTATPDSDYVFLNWTENGTVVSSDASYSFTVNEDRNLKANFEPVTSIRIPGKDSFVIRPNPASENFRLSNMGNVDVTIYSLTGTCIASHKDVNPNGLINIYNIESGVYIVVIETRTDRIICKKLVINN